MFVCAFCLQAQNLYAEISFFIIFIIFGCFGDSALILYFLGELHSDTFGPHY